MGTKRTPPDPRVCQEMQDGLTGATVVKVFPELWGAPGPTGPSAQALHGEGAGTEGNASFGFSFWKGLITTAERKGMTMAPGIYMQEALEYP